MLLRLNRDNAWLCTKSRQGFEIRRVSHLFTKPDLTNPHQNQCKIWVLCKVVKLCWGLHGEILGPGHL